MKHPAPTGDHDSKRLYGLIGFPLDHSYSKRYFTKKFTEEGIEGARYELYPIRTPGELPALLDSNPGLSGLNVTIPYKEDIIAFLDELDEDARAISAVNTIEIRGSRLKGYNTDVIGFREAIREWLPLNRALILGSGGASKAAAYALRGMNIVVDIVSRNATKGDYTYDSLDSALVGTYDVIVQATPVGQYPRTDEVLPFPFEGLTERHCVFDMIYNPDKTVFLERSEQRGCRIQNGHRMLVEQAEASWNIWTK